MQDAVYRILDIGYRMAWGMQDGRCHGDAGINQIPSSLVVPLQGAGRLVISWEQLLLDGKLTSGATSLLGGNLTPLLH